MGETRPRFALLVGLGNPGRDYADTRHNAGWWLLDALAERRGGRFVAQAKFHGQAARIAVAGQPLWLFKPDTYMNHSGRAVRAFTQFYRIGVEQVLIAHDELDLPPGAIKLKQGGGHGGHNGLRDSCQALASRDFWRLRLGIGHPGHKGLVSGYVLARAPRAEEDAIRAGIEQIERHFTELLTGHFGRATQAINGFAPPG